MFKYKPMLVRNLLGESQSTSPGKLTSKRLKKSYSCPENFPEVSKPVRQPIRVRNILESRGMGNQNPPKTNFIKLNREAVKNFKSNNKLNKENKFKNIVNKVPIKSRNLDAAVKKNLVQPLASKVKAPVYDDKKQRGVLREIVQNVKNDVSTKVEPTGKTKEKILATCVDAKPAETKSKPEEKRQHEENASLSSFESTFPSNVLVDIDSNNAQLSKAERQLWEELVETTRNEIDFTRSKDESTVAKSSVWNESDFVLIRDLGSGGFANVKLVREKKSDRLYAMKVCLKKKYRDIGFEDLIGVEVNVQKRLNHPNIIKMFGYFEDEEKIYMIFEYAPKGTFYSKIALQPNKRFNDLKAAPYIRELIYAIRYCHNHRIIHKDIKPENLLLGANNELKLTDFGLAKRVPKLTDFSRKSPETLLDYSYQNDIWGIGVLTYELLVGYPPFSDHDTEKVYSNISRIKYKVQKYLKRDALDFISKILIKDPEKRLTLDQMLNHPWIKNHSLRKCIPPRQAYFF